MQGDQIIGTVEADEYCFCKIAYMAIFYKLSTVKRLETQIDLKNWFDMKLKHQNLVQYMLQVSRNQSNFFINTVWGLVLFVDF